MIILKTENGSGNEEAAPEATFNMRIIKKKIQKEIQKN